MFKDEIIFVFNKSLFIFSYSLEKSIRLSIEKIDCVIKHSFQETFYFRTKPNQHFPWVISERIFIKRILLYSEVKDICLRNGVKAQKLEE